MPVKSSLKREADDWLQKLLGEGNKSKSSLPAPAFKYLIEMNGILVGAFTECSGLNAEREVELHKEGGVNDHVHMLPGRTTRTNIQLKRGITLDNKLWEWYDKGIHTGLAKESKLCVLLYNQHGELVRRWEIPEAFPVKWVGPTLETSSNQVAIEMLEIAPAGSKAAGATISRKEEEGAAVTGTGSSTGDVDPKQAINVDDLAKKVYKLMRNEVRLDQERSARRGYSDR